MSEVPYHYDVALSFAGENRPYVEAVAIALRSEGVRVFYDAFEESTLWGKDLFEHLDTVYRERARYCVMFISKEYAEKVWTTHERRSAFARSLHEREEYILPARFDDTTITGLHSTVGYIDLRAKSPEQLASLIARKLRARDEETTSPQEGESTGQKQYTSCSDFFNVRFLDSFPGQRDVITWHQDQAKIMLRLRRLLRQPLTLQLGENQWIDPISWWHGRSSYPITSFQELENGLILINEQLELKIKKMASISFKGYWERYVYLETEALAPTGIVTMTEEDWKWQMENRGFVKEEVGYYKGEYIKPELVEDGCIETEDDIIDMDGTQQKRIRYLTPYNIAIVSNDTLATASLYRPDNEDLFKHLLTRQLIIDDFVAALEDFPKNVMYFGSIEPYDDSEPLA